MITPAQVAKLRRKAPKAVAAVEQLIRRASQSFTDPRFAAQTAFIDDPARLKVLLCGRRAGKSFGVARYLCKIAQERPGSNGLYIALTRDSAKKAIWKDALKVLVPQLGLKAEFNETDLTVTFANGSVIYVMGADANEKVKERIRGGKYALAVVDEAASFGATLNDLVTKILRPAVADDLGTICLTGTPANAQAGLFYEITKDQDPANPGCWTVTHADTATHWSGHRWTARENPYMREQWETDLAAMRAVNPLIERSPVFQAEQLGRWIIDDTKRVYKYVAGFNDFDGQLPHRDGTWYWLLGIDLGYEDDTAFVVGAYNDDDPTLYLVECVKAKHLDIPDVSERVRELERKYKGFDRKIIDGANKQAVETMRRRESLALLPADKREKWDFIQLMNGDFVTQRIKLSPACASLVVEYAKLVRDEQTDKPREKDGLPNHACDAALYLWRHAYHYLGREPAKAPEPGTPRWHEDQVAMMRENARREAGDAARQREERSFYDS